jgi:hypothetical protein
MRRRYKTFAGLDPCESMMGHAQSMFMFADEVNVQTVTTAPSLRICASPSAPAP